MKLSDLETINASFFEIIYVCSECGYKRIFENYNYCPNCGEKFETWGKTNLEEYEKAFGKKPKIA